MLRDVLNMDYAWHFHSGDIMTEKANTHAASYMHAKSGTVDGPGGKCWYDNDWRIVDLPHDYFAESMFAPDNLLTHGYRYRNDAWYRKSFVLDPSYQDKELYICFEATAVNADFYFNGSLISRSFTGYIETFFDITERAYFDGRPNVLAVHIKGMPIEGWWYEGAGIYRHVKLYVKDKLHIAHNGIFGKPFLRSEEDNSWGITVETTIENSEETQQEGLVIAELLDDGQVLARCEEKFQCDFAASQTVHQAMFVENPIRWDVDLPKLYTLRVTVMKNGVEADTDSVRIGFRTFSVDADKGFFLNGRPLKIKGVCNHQDHAGVGVAVPDSVQYYRVKKLKEMGANAYRCAHNPPAKEILDACDELGIIVMDENRHFETRSEVLGYLESMIRRDRNHPSVFFWSLFNEEPLQNTEEGARIYRRLRSVVRRLDDTRLVTGAINGNMEGAGMEMDITGINYGIHGLAQMHKLHPEQPIIGTENASAIATRGNYQTSYEDHILSCYDEETVPWGQTIRETWDVVRKNDFLSGVFMWTGFDYRGEPSPFRWPSVSSQFGLMDTCGFPKDSYYFCKACFTEEPMIHLLPHWNHQEGDIVRVMAVTNCDEAELFLNGRSLGRKTADICNDTPEWKVVYEQGVLSAKAYKDGVCVAETEQVTAGEPYAIKLISDGIIKNDGLDTAIINCCIVDEKGVVVPDADNLLHFSIEGDGYIRGVGNGDPNSHESDVLPERKLFHGWCQVLITAKTDGHMLSFHANADHVKAASIEFKVEQVVRQATVTDITNYLLDGFTVSEVSENRPDVLKEVKDNDMNSFVPVTFTQNIPDDFVKGWRIYRVTPKFPSDASVTLHFAKVCFDNAEVYVDGLCIDRIEDVNNGSYETPAFSVRSGQQVDIRILMHATGESDIRFAGIAGQVEVREV